MYLVAILVISTRAYAATAVVVAAGTAAGAAFVTIKYDAVS